MRAVLLSRCPRLTAQLGIALGHIGIGLDAAGSEEQASDLVQTDAGHLLLIADLDEADDPVPFVAHMVRSKSALRALVCASREGMPRVRTAIERGAHEFMLKPIDAEELRLRVSCLASGAANAASALAGAEIVLGPLRVSTSTQEVWLDERPIRLTPRERSLLHLLIRGGSSVVAKDRLAERIFSLDGSGSSQAIETYIYRLRRKLAHPAVRIRTLRGLGYQLTLRDRYEGKD